MCPTRKKDSDGGFTKATRRGCGTNDDGITSPGLLALKDVLTDVGRVTVLAPNVGRVPDHNWSASGHVKTMHKAPVDRVPGAWTA